MSDRPTYSTSPEGARRTKSGAPRRTDDDSFHIELPIVDITAMLASSFGKTLWATDLENLTTTITGENATCSQGRIPRVTLHSRPS